MTNKKYLISCLLAFVSISLTAQVRFSANAAAMARSADALLGITATSSYAKAVEGEIVVTVTEDASALPILTLVFAKAIVMPGSSQLSSFKSAVSMAYFENQLSSIAKNTGQFAPGSYFICCQFTPEDKALINAGTEQCFLSNIVPRTPLVAIQPADNICNLRPAFSWQGRKTPAAGVAFRVVCTEVTGSQSPEEALQNNSPVLNTLIYQQMNQTAYPMGSPALKEGKKYAWQVLEMADNNVLNNSEVVEFTTGCKESSAAGPESFAEVKPVYTGKRYYFTNTINFSFRNPYVEKKLEYSIVQVAGKKKVNNLPELSMMSGLNSLVLDVSDVKGLQKGEEYMLQIHNLSGTLHYINFIIKE